MGAGAWGGHVTTLGRSEAVQAMKGRKFRKKPAKAEKQAGYGGPQETQRAMAGHTGQAKPKSTRKDDCLRSQQHRGEPTGAVTPRGDKTGLGELAIRRYPASKAVLTVGKEGRAGQGTTYIRCPLEPQDRKKGE